MLTHGDRLAIVEAVWPGTLGKSYVEQSNRLVTLYAVEEGKDGGATPAELEALRLQLLERLAAKEAAS